LLFRNDGRGRFTLAKDAGLDRFGERDGSWMAAAAADFDRDGWIDVYVAAHTQSAWVESPDADLPEPYHDANNGAPNLLLRNLGGRFAEVTDPGIQQNNRRFSFAAAWGDYDNDGDPDLYVANDFGRNNLYRNNGDGSFRDVAAEAGVEDLGAGMSVAWEDFDNDGRLDLYVGNMWSSAGLRVTGQDRFHNERNDVETAALQRHARGNSLFRNRGDGTFEDVTQKSRRRPGPLGLEQRVLRLRQRRPGRHLCRQRLCYRGRHRRPLKLPLAAGRVAFIGTRRLL
jgi:hypothetical protein